MEEDTVRWDVPDLTPAEQAQRARERMLRNNRDMLSGQGPFSERPTPARLLPRTVPRRRRRDAQAQ